MDSSSDPPAAVASNPSASMLALSSGASLPTSTFTAREALVDQVQLVLAAEHASPVAFLLATPDNRGFLAFKVLQERCVRNLAAGRIAVLVAGGGEVAAELWAKHLDVLLDQRVTLALDGNSAEEAHLIVATEKTAPSILGQHGESVDILVVDNAQVLLEDTALSRAVRETSAKGARVLALTSSIMLSAPEGSLRRLAAVTSSLADVVPGMTADTSCDLATGLRAAAFPRMIIVSHGGQNAQNDPELRRLEEKLERLERTYLDLLDQHQYSLFETYGGMFSDLIADIPDPVALPRTMLEDLRAIRRNWGYWATGRAATLLLVRLERLKMREKYERHFLLLGAAHTAAALARRAVEEAFSQNDDEDEISDEGSRMLAFSTPALRTLVDVLVQYQPDHVGRNDEKAASRGRRQTRARRGRKGGGVYSSYDDPDSLHGVIFCQSAFAVKVIYHFLRELSRTDDRFSFLSPQYAVAKDEEERWQTTPGQESTSKAKRRQEEALRRFRTKEANLLVTSSNLEIGLESARCNLVVALDAPEDFASFAYQRVKARAKGANILYFSCASEVEQLKDKLRTFLNVERYIISGCAPTMGLRGSMTTSVRVEVEMEAWLAKGPFMSTSFRQVNLANALFHVNRYCAKLPSDTFTRLTPAHVSRRVTLDDGGVACVCSLLLPVNSPLRTVIHGAPMPTEGLAAKAAALETMRQLHSLREVDDSMVPVGKDNSNVKCHSSAPSTSTTGHNVRTGTSKRRQYYYKRVAPQLTTAVAEGSDNGNRYHLYAVDLTLSCPIPESQNTRGRRIYPPEEARQSFGLLTVRRLPEVCAFPIYTRSGEVIVRFLHLKANEVLEAEGEKISLIRDFHQYTFSQVLRMEKYPMVFSPEQADNSVLVVPLKKQPRKDIDWDFLRLISSQKETKLSVVPDEERTDFVFDPEEFSDAVVMPWYRNRDQPQYFYVAEICRHLKPTSAFPAQGFDTFEKYYKGKYGIQVRDLEQPLLDVDHTSARLNFLTPRYVNRKGISLPSSSEETKRSKRENLDQKQILVPELCSIHPFPATLWRQAVSLPCVLYRLNGLLIADKLRVQIATEMGIGEIDLFLPV